MIIGSHSQRISTKLRMKLSQRTREFLNLITVGSDPIKRFASQQLAIRLRDHIHELYYVFIEIIKLAKSENWETRVIAAQTIRNILHEGRFPEISDKSFSDFFQNPDLEGIKSFQWRSLLKGRSILGSGSIFQDAPSIKEEEETQMIDEIITTEVDNWTQSKSKKDKNSHQKRENPEISKFSFKKECKSEPTFKSDYNFEDSRENIAWLFHKLRKLIFHPNWDVRHGSVMCIHELVRYPKVLIEAISFQSSLNPTVNQIFLPIIFEFLQILLLDDFADYTSDEIVAPVRETTSQALATILNNMSTEFLVSFSENVVLKILQDWDSCPKHALYGIFLCLKYLISISGSSRYSILKLSLPIILVFISKYDSVLDEDIFNVALSIVQSYFVDSVHSSFEEVQKIFEWVWMHNFELEDDSCCIKSSLKLIHHFCSYCNGSYSEKSPQTENLFFVSRLLTKESRMTKYIWNLLQSSLSSVRSSALVTASQILRCLNDHLKLSVSCQFLNDRKDVLDVNSMECTKNMRVLYNLLLNSLFTSLISTTQEDMNYHFKLHLEALENLISIDICIPESIAFVPYLISLICFPSGREFDPSSLPMNNFKASFDELNNSKESLCDENFNRSSMICITGDLNLRNTGKDSANDGFLHRVCCIYFLGIIFRESFRQTLVQNSINSEMRSEFLNTLRTQLKDLMKSKNSVQHTCATLAINSFFSENFHQQCEKTIPFLKNQEQRCRHFSSNHHFVDMYHSLRSEVTNWIKSFSDETFNNSKIENDAIYEEESNILQAIECSRQLLKRQVFQLLEMSNSYNCTTSKSNQRSFFMNIIDKTGCYKINDGFYDDSKLVTITKIICQAWKSLDGHDRAGLERNLEVKKLIENILSSFSNFEKLMDDYQKYHEIIVSRRAALTAATCVALEAHFNKLNPILKPLLDHLKIEVFPLFLNISAECISNILSTSIRNSAANISSKLIKVLSGVFSNDSLMYPPFSSSQIRNIFEDSDFFAKTIETSNIKFNSTDMHIDNNDGKMVFSYLLLKLNANVDSKSRMQYRENYELVFQFFFSNLGNEKNDFETYFRVFREFSIEKLIISLESLTTEKGDADNPKKAMLNQDIRTNFKHSASLFEVLMKISTSQNFSTISSLYNADTICQLFSLLSSLMTTLEDTSYRFVSSRILARICVTYFGQPFVLHFFQFSLLELLECPSLSVRASAIEFLHHLIDASQPGSVINAIIFVPIIRRVNDFCVAIRTVASNCLSKVVQLMPSDKNEIVSQIYELCERSIVQSGDSNYTASRFDVENFKDWVQNQLNFAFQLIDQQFESNDSGFRPESLVNVPLRDYQLVGVNWLLFLRNFNLGGALCDDMGLGKTLQTICVLARSYQLKDSAPSLIIVPSSLVHHWCNEISYFCDKGLLNPFSVDSKNHPTPDLEIFKTHNVCVASYEVMVKQIQFFSSVVWNYVILDEAHLIKNCNSQKFKCAKQLLAMRRLVLTGTPIQNNVSELWSLFDFLMPGFLGDQQEFNGKFARPIQRGKSQKCTAAEFSESEQLSKNLHQLIHPFTLRRLKEHVLRDLPPKIISDIQCDLSPVQQILYDNLISARVELSEGNCNEVEEELKCYMESASKSRVLESLTFLRKVCNHPALALTEDHPCFPRIQKLTSTGSLQNVMEKLRDDVSYSGKLLVLKELLIFTLGMTDPSHHQSNIVSDKFDASSSSSPVSVTSEEIHSHKALIFCQTWIKYLRLDGTIPINERAEKFRLGDWVYP